MLCPEISIRGRTIAIAAAWLGASLSFGTLAAAQDSSSRPVMRPTISEDVSPFEIISPVARDGHPGRGVLRKPPGSGPFPAALVIHGGLITLPRGQLEAIVSAPMPSRLLAAGYVVAAITYRSRAEDPQSTGSIADTIAAVEYLRTLPYVDPNSIVIYGCSSGGDLALQAAAATDLAAIAPEEPASVLFTGVLNKNVPKRGERYTPADAAPLMMDPLTYYTVDFQKVAREKIARIRTPILILEGDEQNLENRFNAQVLIPELKSAGKSLEVIAYAGEPHCFALASQAPRPAVALKAFQDVDTFFRRHVKTQPKRVDAINVKESPVASGQIAIPLPILITAVGNPRTAFAGRWQASLLASNGMTVELNADGTRLTGSIQFEADTPGGQGRAGSAEIYDGRIDGNRISFKVKSPGSGDRTITFTGTLNGDEIAFTREVEVRPGGAPGGPGIFGIRGEPTFTAVRTR